MLSHLANIFFKGEHRYIKLDWAHTILFQSMQREIEKLELKATLLSIIQKWI